MPSVSGCAPPPILFRGRHWSTSELAGMAAGWREPLAREIATAEGPLALVMANHPETIALFFAASCLPVPVILLPSDLRGWQSSPPVPTGTRVVLPPVLADRAGEVARLGLASAVLSDADPAAGPGDAPFMSAPGFVFFTSGSTGLPRPVYRTAAQVIEGGRAPMAAVGVPAGGVIGALPLDRTFGMHHTLMTAALTRRPLALLERFEHNAVLDLFASGDYQYWAGTPVMADVLGRCSVSWPGPAAHPAPAICVISGRLSGPVCRAFSARFAAPLRQVYGTTETGAVTMETGPAARVRSDTAGRPLPGVRIRIGDHPRAPVPTGEVGRVWISSPGCAQGYGFPPDLEPLAEAGTWWPSPDVGRLDADGRLLLSGRLDDCVRTGAGHVVSPAVVAEVLESYPGILEAVVIPLGPPAQPVLGALLESPVAVNADALREHLTRALPAWARPRLVEQTRLLPRLPSGKPDRLACAAALEGRRP